ncbi:MAG: transposase [Actinomycetota bacterium]|nr:transposase [Actinomycetota bacterium]
MATVFEVRDERWELVEPMIPPVRQPERQGRRPVPDQVCFNAIVFVLVTGIAWAHLPRELGCSGTTAWRRLRDWQRAGVWERLHGALLDRVNGAGAIDGSASVVDGSHIRALQGGLDRALPVDRGRPGSKHHVRLSGVGSRVVDGTLARGRALRRAR